MTTLKTRQLSSPSFQRSKRFFPTLDRLLDIYNDIAEGKTPILPKHTTIPTLLDILRTNRPLFLPYLDTDLVERQLLLSL